VLNIFNFIGIPIIFDFWKFLKVRLVSVLQMRQELEKIRRRLEAELAEAREQLAEKTSQLDELQTMMNRREEELQQALNK